MFQKIEKDISTYQIIIFLINKIESTSRSRRNPKKQKDVVMKSRSRSLWTLILKMLNSRMLQRKLAWVILKRNKIQINMNPLKARRLR